MPMFTYTPKWETVGVFLKKMKPVLPPGYTGLAAIRLHRTGHPLALEIFPKGIPKKPLYPVVLLEFKNGELVRDLAKLEEAFDVPWTKIEDYNRFRDDVMWFYMAEDILEPRAEEIIKSENPDETLLRKNFVDHEAVLAEA